MAAFSMRSPIPLLFCYRDLLLTNHQFFESGKYMALPLPDVTPESEPFWSGGAVGELRITMCKKCDHRIHPPQLICPVCLSRNVAINHQPWLPGLKVPYALGVIDLDDQSGVRMTAMLKADDLSSIVIGAPVSVDFERREDVYVPFFRLS
jgi:uncharacterized protein